MIYKNIEIYNIAEIVDNGDGSVSWIRVPSSAYEKTETSQGKNMLVNSTGVELRFVIKSGNAVIKMATKSGGGLFHVYRGSIQGGWEDHEVNKFVNTKPQDFVIKKSENIDRLNEITRVNNYPFAPEIIRVIFDRGSFKIFDIIGDVEPPTTEQLPKKTLMCYGSSITHGSNSLDISHSWVSVLAHNLKMDARNLGMAGSCRMEPEIVDYIASEGEKGNWDTAILELGINALDFEEDKIISRAKNTIFQIASRNRDKSVFVVSPFYYYGDYFTPEDRAKIWRKILPSVVKELKLANVTYINGADVLNDCSFISADEMHPNIYGVQRIAEKMTELVGKAVCDLQQNQKMK